MEKIPNLNHAIAAAVREAREKAGLTQVQLADFSGLSEPYISALERGAKGDSLNAFFLIAAALQVPPTALLKRVEEFLASGAALPDARRGRPVRR